MIWRNVAGDARIQFQYAIIDRNGAIRLETCSFNHADFLQSACIDGCRIKADHRISWNATSLQFPD